METYYSYTLSDLNDVCHYVMPSEKEYGIQNYIVRNAGAELEDQFKVHANLVKELFPENAPRDVVFMQVAGPGKAFEQYDKVKCKLPITLKAYIKLLKFFETEYPRVLSRSDADSQIMTAGVKWLSLSPSITFRKPADICFKKTLERGVHQNLELFYEKRHLTGKRCVTLKYTNQDLGILFVPPPAMTLLAKEVDIINNLQDYIGVSMPKKSRQS